MGYLRKCSYQPWERRVVLVASKRAPNSGDEYNSSLPEPKLLVSANLQIAFDPSSGNLGGGIAHADENQAPREKGIEFPREGREGFLTRWRGAFVQIRKPVDQRGVIAAQGDPDFGRQSVFRTGILGNFGGFPWFFLALRAHGATVREI
ncbi:MAG: hypothetical protein ACLFRG_23780 [Desulfococcaceae bacterium]